MPILDTRIQWSGKRRVVFVLFLVLFLLTSGYWRLTYSQITPLEQARQDYSYQSTKYQEAKNRYLAAKSNYQAFNTAVAKNEAFVKTQEYVVQIPNVYITYLKLINERSNLYDWGSSSFSKDDEHKLIQEEIKKLETLKEEATKLTTLEETVAHSKKLQTQITENTIPTAYRLLARTDYAQLKELEYLFDINSQKINEHATAKISENNRPLLLNWQTEVENTKDKIKESLDTKKKELDNIEKNSSFKLDKPEYKFTTDDQRNIFSPTVSLLKEILNQI